MEELILIALEYKQVLDDKLKIDQDNWLLLTKINRIDEVITEVKYNKKSKHSTGYKF